MKTILDKFGNLLLIILLLSLLLWSGYQSATNWRAYQYYKKTSHNLQNIKFIQSLEHAIFNEMVCAVTINKHKDKFQHICKEMEKTTDSILSQIKQSDFDPNIYALKNNVQQFRAQIRKSSYYAIEAIKNGQFKKEIHSYIQNYLDQIGSTLYNRNDKKILEVYKKLLDISYSFESEKVLLAYYLSRKIPMNADELIAWDSMTSRIQDNFSALENKNKNLSNIYNKWHSEAVQKVIREIESVRLDVMAHASSGNYQTPLIEWIRLSNEKQSILMNIEDEIIDTFVNKLESEAEKSLNKAIMYGIVALLSLLALLLYISSLIRMSREKRYFLQMASKIAALDDQKKHKPNLYDSKLTYSYIENGYEKLYTRKQKLEEELKNKDRFFTQFLYDLQSPLDSISGYGALLSETPMDAEQKTYCDEISSNASKTEKMIESSPIKYKEGKIEEPKITEESINIVIKTESTIEKFVPRATQKDIHLSLYTDPSLNQYVYANADHIYKVLTHLLHRATNRTQAYGSIDVFVEKINEDDQSITIKYKVIDHNEIMSKDEIERLQDILSSDGWKHNEDLNTEEEMLVISNRLLTKLGSKLEFKSLGKKENLFYFTIRLPKDVSKEAAPSAQFENMSIGIALPTLNITRQQEKNIEVYANTLGVSCKIYDYDTLEKIKSDSSSLPDVLLVYHHYARLQGELDMFKEMDCETALITKPSLRSSDDLNAHSFCCIVYEPLTYTKIIKILSKIKDSQNHDNSKKNEDKSEIKPIEEKTDTDVILLLDNKIVPNKNDDLKDINLLIAEDNEIQQKLWKERLNNIGITGITLTSDSKEILKERKENSYDIIMIDLDMLISDGPELLNEILYYERINQLQHVPVIAFGANQDAREKYIKLGFDEIILKNASEKEIRSIINHYAIEVALLKSKEEEDALIAKMLSGDLFEE